MTVSVIIPVYNVEKYLRQCLESVCSQTYSDLEIMLVNDGSTDGSAAICKEFAENDKRIKYIEKENGGLVSAWKCGVKNSTGELIAFVDSDDYVTPDYIKGMVNAFAHCPDALFVAANAMRYTGNGNVTFLRLNNVEKGVIEFDEKVLCNLLFDKKGFGNTRWSKLIKREAVQNILEYCDENVSFGEDQMFIAAIVLQGGKAYLIENADYVYRRNSYSITQGLKRNIFDKFLLLYDVLAKLPGFFEIENAQLQLNTMLINNLSLSFLHYAKHKEPIKSIAKVILNDSKVKSALNFCDYENMGRLQKMLYKAMKSGRPGKISFAAHFANFYIKLRNKDY